MSFVSKIFHKSASPKEIAIKSKKTLEKKIKERWFESEGKLAVDLYKTGEYLVVQATIAGVKPEDFEINIQGDIVSVKGTRTKPEADLEKSYFYEECYWGPFSRQVVLPEEVDPSRAEASLQDGILSIRIPCIEKDKKRKISIKS